MLITFTENDLVLIKSSSGREPLISTPICCDHAQNRSSSFCSYVSWIFTDIRNRTFSFQPLLISYSTGKFNLLYLNEFFLFLKEFFWIIFMCIFSCIDCAYAYNDFSHNFLGIFYNNFVVKDSIYIYLYTF